MGLSVSVQHQEKKGAISYQHLPKPVHVGSAPVLPFRSHSASESFHRWTTYTFIRMNLQRSGEAVTTREIETVYWKDV